MYSIIQYHKIISHFKIVIRQASININLKYYGHYVHDTLFYMTVISHLHYFCLERLTVYLF